MNSAPTTSLPPAQHNAFVEWAVASRPCPGETVSGDLFFVGLLPDGIVAGVVDGLGHGAEAHAAAGLAVNVLDRHRHEPVIALVGHCHRELKASRGAVMTVISLDARKHTLTALGVGNVETVLLRRDPATGPARETVLLRNGVVGDNLPVLQAGDFPLAPGDVLIFVTDGIRDDFAERLSPLDAPAVLAGRILQQHFRGNDDALVLVIRYRGHSHG